MSFLLPLYQNSSCQGQQMTLLNLMAKLCSQLKLPINSIWQSRSALILSSWSTFSFGFHDSTVTWFFTSLTLYSSPLSFVDSSSSPQSLNVRVHQGEPLNPLFLLLYFLGNLTRLLTPNIVHMLRTPKFILPAWTSLPISRSNYLVDKTTWLSNRNLKLNTYQNDLEILSAKHS